MASRAAALLVLSLLTLGPSPALSGANDAVDCCLSVTQHPIPRNIVCAFRHQLIKDGCRVPAVVFTTLKGRQLCAPPDKSWVNNIIYNLKTKREQNHRSYPQSHKRRSCLSERT